MADDDTTADEEIADAVDRIFMRKALEAELRRLSPKSTEDEEKTNG